ncbi:MAG: hypothetical protein ACI4JA_02985 [Oscillospiraceae bacterium]
MKRAKITAMALAFAMCCSMASCDNSDKTDKEISSADVSSAAEGLEYAPSGDQRLFDSLKEKYGDNYKLTCKYNGSEALFSISGGRSYYGVGESGAKNIIMYTTDKKLYKIMESTKMYSVSEDDFDVRDCDPLFGATDEFVSAEKDEKAGTFNERYTVDKELVGAEGEIEYAFDTKTGDLKSYTITVEEQSVEYQVIELAEADESLFTLPDLSGYTESK